MPLFFFALLAGAATVAGPCILPLLPVVLGSGSSGRAHSARPLFVVLGFVVAFSAFVLLFSAFGRAVPVSSDAVRVLGAALIGLFGLTLLFPRLSDALFARFGALASRLPQGNASLLGGFVLGASLGIVWTPCAGPVLGAILALVATRQDLGQAAGLLLAYAIGAGGPMLLIAYGGQAVVARARGLVKYAAVIQRVFGVLILLVAVGLLTGADRTVQTYLLERAPWLFLNRYINL